MSDVLTCWKCSKELVNVILPMSRREECIHCCADQHVCKMCYFFDGRNGCDEEQAEDVSDNERANFCDYFKPMHKSQTANAQQKSDDAKAKLAALFGDPEPEKANPEEQLTPAQLAEKKLRAMLNS